MHQVSVGYPTMHKALVFLYVYNSTLWSLESQEGFSKKKKKKMIFLFYLKSLAICFIWHKILKSEKMKIHLPHVSSSMQFYQFHDICFK